jgi:hypothetical protein
VAIHDSRLWELILSLKRAEMDHFGTLYSGPGRELKAKRLLKRKTFRLAAQMDILDPDERRALAHEALAHGGSATRRSLTGLAQAKVAFCKRALEICAEHGVTYFASIVHPDAPAAAGDALRKDYSYLFQRLYYFLEQHGPAERGLLVMDEMDQTEAHQLMGQMSTYFQRTAFGRARCRRIVPQPFFVHSDLTTGVQIADLVAYTLSWNIRLPGMDRPARPELDPLGNLIRAEHRQYRVPGLTYSARSFVYLEDLRTRSEKDVESRERPAAEPLSASAVNVTAR